MPAHRLFGLITAMLIAAMMTLSPCKAHGQPCASSWLAGPMSTALPGADGPIYAMTVYSAGGGPLKLIVAGKFSHISGIAANNIASWDGAVWQPLEAGCDGTVRSLVVYNGALIAGGEFISPGVRIASWNGSTWAAMGEIGPPTPIPGISVKVMTVFNGYLHVGGRFETVNGFGIIDNAARYMNGTWSIAAGNPWEVDSMAIMDWDGAGPQAPLLYVGGFGPPGSCLRCTQDGATTTDVYGPLGHVYALAPMTGVVPFPNSLVVAGDFRTWYLGNGEFNYDVNNIVRLYGPGNQMITMGDGVVGGLGGVEFVSSLYTFGEDWYITGFFLSAGGLQAPGIVRIDTSENSWAQVAGGFAQSGGHPIGYAMCAYNNFLYVGGKFDSADNAPGVVGVQNIARWNNIAWGSVGQKPRVQAVASLGSRLIVGGDFSHTVQETPSSPPLSRYNILTWDGVNTGSLGQGVNAQVRSLLSFTTGSGPSTSNVLVAGGYFTTVYGDGLNPSAPIAANRVAQWTESSSGLPSWSAMGSGFNSIVHALARFNGWTVAGGAFTASGGTTTNSVAKYVGSPPSWQPLTSPDPGINGTVFALKSFSDDLGGTNNYLVMGGAFTAAPATGVAANRILMRVENPVSGNSSYQALGAGFNNGFVYAIERYGNGLNARTYAAGSFTTSGATTVNRIAVLNGANWQPVGNGVGFNNVVYALRSHGGFLYAAGAFTSVDGIAANHVARWNGTAWSAVDFGSDDEVDALGSFGAELIAGGYFNSVKSPALPSPALARFTQTGMPWIAAQPMAKSVACGADATFTITPAPGYDVTYSWSLNGAGLIDGPTPFGSTVSGSATASLTISGVRSQDAGNYACTVFNPCGLVTSSNAMLTVGTCCVADIAPAGPPQGDGFVNVNDLLAVINQWGACPAPPATCTADISPAPPNNDHQVNVNDLLAIINNWGQCH